METASNDSTISFRQLVAETIENMVEIVYIKTCDYGYIPLPNNVHPVGEYSIEVVLKKI